MSVLGIKRSEETKQKMRDAYSGKTRKKVVCYLAGCPATVYDGLRIASRETGVNAGNISRCCNGFRETAGGYEWRWM